MVTKTRKAVNMNTVIIKKRNVKKVAVKAEPGTLGAMIVADAIAKKLNYRHG